jgi:DNA invertase Pin-like site-specific DNA recombinase
VSIVAAAASARLSRRGIGQFGQLLDDFEKAGGRLVSLQDQLDTPQPQARMIIALLSEFARAESETTGQRVKSAKEAQRVAACG